eukprot:213450_1
MTAIERINNLLDTLSEHKTEHKSVQECDFIETTIIYMKDTGKKYVIDMSQSNTSYNLPSKGIITKVHNARNSNCIFKSHGFQLINHITKLSTKDFYTNPNDKIQSIYYQEIESIIKSLTNAQFVKAFEHQIRSTGSKPQYATVNIGLAAHGAHSDFTQYSALKCFKSALLSVPKDDYDYTQGRFAVINVWRNISDINDIKDYHLAVMDAQTVITPDDFLKYDFIPSDGTYKAESYYLNASGAPHHKWYYFPGMKKNEMLVFIQYDTDFKSTSRFAFHTAIYDPTFDSTEKEFVRESIELRLVAFFPKYTPNTIPSLHFKMK